MRNIRNANPNMLFIEGTYLTQASWSLGGDKNVVPETTAEDGKKLPAKWQTYQVLKLEHATLLQLGAVAAAASSALLL
jgi:hypothetical protein